jgi:phosphotransferase system enzyme I (PtsI)
MAEIRCTGRGASPGIATGALFVLRSATAARRRAGSPAEEQGTLSAALAAAQAELGDMIATAEGEAAEILGFQVAMLEDEALVAPALAEIADGIAADIAWRHALDAQIADYAAADDEYFRARVADLTDIRDRVLQKLSGAAIEALPKGAVIAADDLTPSRFLGHDWSAGGGIVLAKGSASSHVAMLARARHVPMVVGVACDLGKLNTGAAAIVDGAAGLVILDPSAEARRDADLRRDEERARDMAAAAYLRKPAVSRDGTAVAVMINIASADELDGLDPTICDGIGLVRTELLFEGAGSHGLPDEARQYEVYRRILAWAAGRPVIVRTLDAGGDKPIPGLTVDGESNPFLGLRGLRLSLQRPEVFRTQLRALCRAATEGPLKIMLPMVTVPAELEAAKDHLDAVVAALATERAPHHRPPLGIMVEVPSVGLTPERFAAEFFSIGSNDLTQYVMAAARDLNSVAHLADAADPAVLALIARVAEYGERVGIEVSLCGDAASDPALVPHLLRCGLRRLSASPAAVGRVKATIADLDLRPQS